MAMMTRSLLIFSRLMQQIFQNFDFYRLKVRQKIIRFLDRKNDSFFKESIFLTTITLLWSTTLYATESKAFSEEEAEQIYAGTRLPHTPLPPADANTFVSAYGGGETSRLNLQLNAGCTKDQEYTPRHSTPQHFIRRKFWNAIAVDGILISLADYFTSKPPFPLDNCESSLNVEKKAVVPIALRGVASAETERLSPPNYQELTQCLENPAASYEKRGGHTLHAFHCSRKLTQESVSKLQGMYAHWISILCDFLEDSSKGSYAPPPIKPTKFLDKTARFCRTLSCKNAPIHLGGFHFIRHTISVIQRQSFNSQLADTHLLPLIRLEEFPRARKNLILFLGVSSAGKTSVANEFSKLVKPSIILEYDHRLHKTALDFLIQQRHPKFSQLYERFGLSVLHLIFCHPEDPFLKRAVSHTEDTRDLLETLQELQKISLPHLKGFYKRASMSILEEAKILVCLGRTVVVQAADNEAFLSFAEFDPRTVLFYCPFSDLATRVEQRNNIAFLGNNPLEIRHPLGVYRQFSKIFRVKHAKDSAKSLGTVDRNSVSHYVERGLIVDPLYRPSGFTTAELFVNDLLRNMDFEQEKSAEILSRHDYDFYIDTSLVTPLEGARVIRNFYTFLSKMHHRLSKKYIRRPLAYHSIALPDTNRRNEELAVLCLKSFNMVSEASNSRQFKQSS